jgi:hypothetical protein
MIDVADSSLNRRKAGIVPSYIPISVHMRLLFLFFWVRFRSQGEAGSGYIHESMCTSVSAAGVPRYMLYLYGVGRFHFGDVCSSFFFSLFFLGCGLNRALDSGVSWAGLDGGSDLAFSWTYFGDSLFHVCGEALSSLQ